MSEQPGGTTVGPDTEVTGPGELQDQVRDIAEKERAEDPGAVGPDRPKRRRKRSESEDDAAFNKPAPPQRVGLVDPSRSERGNERSAERSGERGPFGSAQHDDDGWGDLPAQMRPQK